MGPRLLVVTSEESSATAGVHAIDIRPGSLVGLSDSSQTTYEETVDRIASHYGLQAEDIIGILPTTQFQRDYLLRKECNYFVLDIPGPVVVDRIHSAVDAVMRKYSAPRTVLVPLRNTLVQVLLRRADSPVRHFSTSKLQLASYVEQLVRADSRVCVPYGALHFQATLVSADDDSHHFLVLCLSHAQYDGFSLARLYLDLSAAYGGRALASAPDYATNMVHRHRHLTTSPLLDFWQEYLAGSSVTKLRPVQDSKQPETAIHLHQEVRVPALPDGITIATLYKAAWALVLARHTHTADLVFGQVVNGRSLPLDGIEEILGACFHVVQADHIQALPYETVDMDELIARCTDWNPLTRLETVTQHQNVPVNPEFRFAGVNCTTFGYEFNYMPCELRMVDEETAALLLDGLCEMVVRLAEHPDAMVTGLM
ncbi:uncharacterized protein CDV56_100484 [Aspergillus thermomutatus]|uniref:Condensation domain-containing protein n=1 Tax=Aspergillus thermomutatus TaxID=41047 RepID=A0A397G0C1_ASPTH|nr:uncharacterized protein CDV56_100484 [Aspergillus thermomutatus]RHZ43264.1 hypothetical protein CDV56_100484 [Aspergillus thermomutatus]